MYREACEYKRYEGATGEYDPRGTNATGGRPCECPWRRSKPGPTTVPSSVTSTYAGISNTHAAAAAATAAACGNENEQSEPAPLDATTSTSAKSTTTCRPWGFA